MKIVAVLLFALAVIAAPPEPIPGQGGLTSQYVEARLSDLNHQIEAADKRYDQRFVASQEAIRAALESQKEMAAQAMASAKEAVLKAEASANIRADLSNGVRDQLREQAKDLYPRKEAEANFASVVEKVDALTKRVSEMSGRSDGLSAGWGILLGAVGLVAGIVSIAMVLRRQPGERRETPKKELS